MIRVTIIALAFCTIYCYSYHYAVANQRHKQTSISFKLDQLNKALMFQHNTCTCNAEAQLGANRNPAKYSTIPSKVCHSRMCIVRYSYKLGKPKVHCEESTMPEEEFRSLQALNIATEVASLDGIQQWKRKK